MVITPDTTVEDLLEACTHIGTGPVQRDWTPVLDELLDGVLERRFSATQ